MATLNSLYATITDFAKRTDPNGQPAVIVDILTKVNPILEDMLWRPTNKDTSHVSTIRSGYPTPTWRKLYAGVQPSKSTTVQVEDAVGLVENWSEIDAEMKEIEGPNFNAFRLSEDSAHIEAMSQDVATTLFYGDTGLTPEKFMGLSPRFGTLTAPTASNIINNGGATANVQTSMWLLCHDPRALHGIFPKNSQAGIKFEELGEETAYDASNGRYRVVRGKYTWRPGLVLKDWRYIVRICNIEVSTLAAAGTSGYTGPNLPNLMIDAHNKQFAMLKNCVWYCNRTVKAALDKIMRFDVRSGLTMETADGAPVMKFWGIPVKVTDSLINTEAVVA